MRIPMGLTVCMLFAVGVFSAALADLYHFEGYGSCVYNGVTYQGQWSGTLNTNSSGNNNGACDFYGNWEAGGVGGTLRAVAFYNPQTGLYEVQYTPGIATYLGEDRATWEGYFDPEGTGNAGGVWSANPPDPYHGTWTGHLVTGP